MNDNDLDVLGPIDYLVVEFPADRKPDGSALPLLIDLVDRNIIRVLDLIFVRKEPDGALSGIAIEDLGFEGGVDVTLFAEAATGLIDRTDLEEAAAVLEPGVPGRFSSMRIVGPHRSPPLCGAKGPSSWHPGASPSKAFWRARRARRLQLTGCRIQS